MKPDFVSSVLERHHTNRDGLISVLESIQDEYGYLPEDALRTLADSMGRSLVDVYGVATFYRAFSLQPRGKHLISVCAGTACHVRGAQAVVEAFERGLGIHAGQTTPDKRVTLETVNCLGACALGPIVVVDGKYFSKVTPVKVDELLDALCSAPDADQVDSDDFSLSGTPSPDGMAMEDADDPASVLA